MHKLFEAIAYFSKDYPDLEYVSEIKSGKEATVYLVQTEGEYLALKLYRQFAQNSARGEYMTTSHLDKRSQRAIRNKSRHGRNVTRTMWTEREFSILSKLHQAGADVPMVYAHSGEAILMEFIGAGQRPAPRLIDVALSTAEAQQALQAIERNLDIFNQLGIVHGDLSPYNVLWHENKPWIIDFPQALDMRQNRNAYTKLEVDRMNIQRFFAARGSNKDQH